jgi:hypothetical protein
VSSSLDESKSPATNNYHLLHHHVHDLSFSITILIVHVLRHLSPLCLMILHALQSLFLSLPPIVMLLLILSGSLLWVRRLLLLSVTILGILSLTLLLFRSCASGSIRSRPALMALLSAINHVSLPMVFSSSCSSPTFSTIASHLQTARVATLAASSTTSSSLSTTTTLSTPTIASSIGILPTRRSTHRNCLGDLC